MTPNELDCPDCGTAVASPDDAEFCSACGQRLSVPQLRAREVVGSVFGSVWSFELPILRTTADLLHGAGPVAAEWIRGRRRTYTNPVQFIVVVGLVVALAYEPIHSTRSAANELGVPSHQAGLGRHASQYFGLFAIALMAPIALAIHAAGRSLGVRRGWAEWYVLGLYAYGLAAALQLVIDVANLWLPNRLANAVMWTQFTIPIVLLTWGGYGFAAGQRARATTAAFLGQLAVLVVVAIAAELLD